MLNAEQLNHFTGTERYVDVSNVCGVRITKDKFLATDGVHYVMENGGTSGAYWLIQAIISHQPTALKHESLRQMQFWRLQKKGKGAVLTCVEDIGTPPVITQDIEHTDFFGVDMLAPSNSQPDTEKFEIWIEYGSADGITPAYVLMLPSER